MIKKAEIEVEEFENGITARWSDTDGAYDPTKSLAIKGNEAECIGECIWGDVREILSNTNTDKVIVKVQYVIPE